MGEKTGQGLDFEAALTELEAVASQLDGEIKLEQALELFDRGMRLSHQCETYLKAAEQKVEILKRRADGSLEVVPFEAEDSAS